MPALPLALPNQSNKAEQPHGGVAALINCYAVPAGDAEQKTQLSIRAGSGLDLVTTLTGTGGCRGLLEVDGEVLAVFGRVLYRIDSGGSATIIGGVPSDGHVGLARNQRGTGVQTAIASGGVSWTYSGGSLVQNTFGVAAVDVCTINQSSIYVTTAGAMYRSDINASNSVSLLDTASAQSSPDPLLRGIDRGGDLIAMGTRSCEIWTDQGAEAFGFSRAAVVNMGAVGARAVTKAVLMRGPSVQDGVAWVGQDRDGRFAGVFFLAGYVPSKISTPWIDRKIDLVADKSTIIASAWVERGHSMIAFRLPDTTVVYDTTTSLWHERQSRDASGAQTQWRIGLATVLNGRVLAGHADKPILYWLDPDTEDEAGDEISMTVRTPPLHGYPNRIECNRVWLDIAPGVGLATGAGQDVDPVIACRLSRDGESWGTARTRRLGRQGNRGRRVDWNSFGTFAQATFEFSCSAAVARQVFSAAWDGQRIAP